MKITVEHADMAENEVILRCPDLDEEMLGGLSLLRSGLQRLCVWDDSRQTTLLSPGGQPPPHPWPGQSGSWTDRGHPGDRREADRVPPLRPAAAGAAGPVRKE